MTRNRLPTYSLHKATGQARVWLNGKDHYLGTYGSEDSRLRYAELIKAHATGVAVDPLAADGTEDDGLSVNELVQAYLTHAARHYQKNGSITAEVHCVRSAVRPLVNLFGDTPAKKFGPAALKAVRQSMIDSGSMCRDFINKSVGRIRRVFKYAVENELIPASVLTGLQALSPLLAGRTDAKDHAPRTAVQHDHLDSVRGHVDEQTRDMIDLAVLTGMRPGELVSLTGGMIDRIGDVWVAVLDDHKTLHQGKARILAFGPKSQAILRRYITLDPTQRLFPLKRATFSNRLKRACVELGISKFTAHWLRHTAATDIRESHGLDAVQAMLGHSSADMSNHYAHLALEKAKTVARSCG